MAMQLAKMNYQVSLLILLAFFLPAYGAKKGQKIDQCETIESSEKAGYKVEKYTVRTQDHYILTLHRIRNPNVPSDRLRRPYVFIHGLLGSSGSWIMNNSTYNMASYRNPDDFCTQKLTARELRRMSEPEGMSRVLENIRIDEHDSGQTSSSLAFSMANFGYDVWLANLRGNHYSSKSDQTSGSRDEKFWKFNVEQLANYDMRTIIDYVKESTKSSKVGVIAYSFSSIMVMQMLHKYPRYNLNIRPLILIGPTLLSGNARDGKHKRLLMAMSKLMLSKDGPFPFLGVMKSNFLTKLCNFKVASKICSLLGNILFVNNPAMSSSSKLMVKDSSCGSTSIAILRQLVENMWNPAVYETINVSGPLRERVGKDEEMKRDVIVVHSEGDKIATISEVNQFIDTSFKDMVLASYTIKGSLGHFDLLFNKNNRELVNRPIVRLAIAYDMINPHSYPSG